MIRDRTKNIILLEALKYTEFLAQWLFRAIEDGKKYEVQADYAEKTLGPDLHERFCQKAGKKIKYVSAHDTLQLFEDFKRGVLLKMLGEDKKQLSA